MVSLQCPVGYHGYQWCRGALNIINDRRASVSRGYTCSTRARLTRRIWRSSGGGGVLGSDAPLQQQQHPLTTPVAEALAAAAFFAAVTTIRTTFVPASPPVIVQIILHSGTSVPDILRPRPRQHSRGARISKIFLPGDPPIQMFAEPPNETVLRAQIDPPIARQSLLMNPVRLDHYFHV